jgi:3D (Asp-Asp-Asp) domain-containing protein
LVDGMTVTALDVFLRVDEEELSIPFGSVVIGDPKLPRDKRVVVTKGSRGSSLRIWQRMVTGGVEGTRTMAAETVITPAVDEVVRVGTNRSFRQLIPAKGTADHVRTRTRTVRAGRRPPAPPVTGRVLTMHATAYTPYECGKDADWIDAQRRQDDIPVGWGVVAVDPKVIPLGSRLFVEGYGYAVAADTGGAIKGDLIDVCFWGDDLSAPTGHASAAQRGQALRAARAWGRRSGVRVTILGS